VEEKRKKFKMEIASALTEAELELVCLHLSEFVVP